MKLRPQREIQHFIEHMPMEAEKAATDKRIGVVYQITKKLYGQKRNTNVLVKVKQCTVKRNGIEDGRNILKKVLTALSHKTQLIYHKLSMMYV